MQAYDALIIGGGPAGGTLGLLLAEAGWSVAIVEKKPFPRAKVCGEFISATSIPLLEKLAIADFFLTHGGPEVRQVGLFAADSVLTAAMPPALDSPHHWGRALGRDRLDHHLLHKASQAGATLWQPWAAKSVTRQADMTIVTLVANDKIKQLAARVVIVANGSWEQGVVPMQPRAHRPNDLLAFKAFFRNCALPSELMPLLMFPGGYGGMVHSEDGRVSLSCCIRRDTLAQARRHCPGPAGDAVLQHIKNTCRGVRQAFGSARREGVWIAAGPIQPGIRQRYADGIFYVGNIAGEAHPVIAEGISMALQSGWLLAEVLLRHQQELVAGGDRASIGREYTKQWDRHFAKRIQAAAVFAHLAMRPWAVSLVLPLLKRFPGMLTLGAKLSGKVKQVVPNAMATRLIASEKENAS